MEEEVLDKYEVEDNNKSGLQRQRRSAGVEAGAQRQEIQNKKVQRRLLGKNLCLVQSQRVPLAASAMQGGGVNGRRRDEAAAKNEDYE